MFQGFKRLIQIYWQEALQDSDLGSYEATAQVLSHCARGLPISHQKVRSSPNGFGILGNGSQPGPYTRIIRDVGSTDQLN